MGRTLTVTLRELKTDKVVIDQTSLTLERLVREQDKESRRPGGEAANASDAISQPSGRKGASRTERHEEAR